MHETLIYKIWGTYRCATFYKKKIKPSNNSDVYDHLLQCNVLPSFDTFSTLAYEKKRYLFKIKIKIMGDKPSVIKNINFATF